MEGIPRPSRGEMSPEELRTLAKVAASFGIKSVKLTGGEPLLREDIAEIVEAFREEGFKDISLVTNGSKLAELALDLKKAGLKRVNVKLDSLDEGTFFAITKADALDEVLEGIEEAGKVGLYPVKLNCVLLKGLNDHEVSKWLLFASEKGAILQIIELIGPPLVPEEVFRKYYMPVETIERYLLPLASKVESRAVQSRTRLHLKQPRVIVELISPFHARFCYACRRLRVTPDGYLKPCLMRNDNLVDFAGLLREGADFEVLREAFKKAVSLRKPFSRTP